MIILKFKTENDFKKAEDIMKKAIDTMASDKFDHSIQPENKTITVSEKNAHIVEGWLNKHNLKFTLDRGFGKYAISDILRTAANNMAPKKVIKKTRIKECDYELCPHCGNEIGEKAIYQNEKGLYFHRACGGAVELPEYDYTKLSDIGLKLITPEQLEIRKRQLKEKAESPEATAFYFQIKTFGNHTKCHPKCQYLNNEYCILFKKGLLKTEDGFMRMSDECISAVEDLI